jgi:hypothetical protein
MRGDLRNISDDRYSHANAYLRAQPDANKHGNAAPNSHAETIQDAQ